MAINLDASLLSCGSLKYGSLVIFVSCLLLGTWGTNNYVGINVKELQMLEKMQQKMGVTQNNKLKPREASLPEPQEALLPKLQEVPLPEQQEALLPTIQEVPLPEPHKALLPKLQEVPIPEQQEALLPTIQEVPLPEPHKALLPKLQEVPLPEQQEALLPTLQEVPLPEPHKTLLPKLQKVPLPEQQEALLPKLREVPLPEPQEAFLPKFHEVAQPQLQEVPQPKLLEVPLVRLSKRDDQLASNVSEDLIPTIDLNCTGPCAKSFEETVGRLADEDGSPHEAGLNDINIFLQTVFQNLSSEKRGEFPNPSKKQKFRNLPNGKLELQQEYYSDEMGNDSADSIDYDLSSPDKLDETINANKSEKLSESDDVEYDKLLKKSQGSSAAAAIFAIMWTASIYGLSSMVMGVKELLIPAVLLFVAASATCIGLIFVDLGAFDTSGFYESIIYLLLMLGAIIKIVAAVIFLYCFFVVFGYYKKLRDGR